MKNIVSRILCIMALPILLAACSPEGFDAPSQAGLPTISELSPKAIVNEETNEVTFYMENKGVVPIWIFGDDDYVTGNNVTRTFRKQGTQSIAFKAYNHNGMTEGTGTIEFHIAKSLDSNAFNFLTGGSSKTWKWDSNAQGHIGCGPSGSNGLDWWSASPNDKEGVGLYDDLLTFDTDNKYTFDPGEGGTVYVNWESGYKPEYLIEDEVDYEAPCDVMNTSFTLDDSGSDTYLVFPANTIVSYIANPDALTNPRYKVINITENVLEFVIDNGNIAWHYQFIPVE